MDMYLYTLLYLVEFETCELSISLGVNENHTFMRNTDK